MLLLNENVLVNDASIYKFECILHNNPQEHMILTPPPSKARASQRPNGLAMSKRSWLRFCDIVDARDCGYCQHNMRYLGRDSA